MKARFSRIIAVVLVLVTVLGLAIPAFAQTNIPKNTWAYVSQKEARCRQQPNKNSTLVKTLSKNTNVKILESTNTYHGWYKVTFTIGGTNYTGYIREDYLKKASQPQEPTELPDYQKEYGTDVFRIGNSSSYIQTIKQDLRWWAINTKYNNTYPQKTVYEAKGCFKNLDSSYYFDDALRLSVRYFQERKGLDIDGVVGNQTKKALYNATH
ncbi:SH3 domain-containing protein [Clostridiales bacterium]|nr:SH3 domain-containing protein [Clostridiales bacterium]